jgi:adenine phosphoribosyltransferase
MFEEVLKFYRDFPIPGINFVDIVPLMQDREVFGKLVSEIGKLVTAPSVAAPEARAFFFSAPLLISETGVTNIVPFRKKGKLPHAGDDLQDIEIMKEYGADHLYFRKSDIAAGKVEDGVIRITILDDILATGGTSEGIAKALEATKVIVDGKECSVKVAEYIFVVELNGLNGRERLDKIAPVYSIAHV